MRRPILFALTLAALASAPTHASAQQRRPAPPAAVPHPPAPAPTLPQTSLTPSIPLTAPTPQLNIPTQAPLAPAPAAPFAVRPPPPPQCNWVETCRDQASQCLANRLGPDSGGYSVQMRDGWPRLLPDPQSRSTQAEQAADDCADNLRQCLQGC
jgi:hypothetical protein